MQIKRDIETTATVGDYDEGDGAKLTMDAIGVRIEDGAFSVMVDWLTWDAVVAEVERHRKVVAAANADERRD